MKKNSHILIAVLCVIFFLFTACSGNVKNSAETPHKIIYTAGDTKEPTFETNVPANSDIEEPPVSENKVAQNYILNTNSKKFHYPSCASAKRIREKNKKYYVGTRSEVIAKGYAPCGNCNP